MRKQAERLIEACESGILNPIEVLKNALFNYMSSDDANDFAISEYEETIGEDNDSH